MSPLLPSMLALPLVVVSGLISPQETTGPERPGGIGGLVASAYRQLVQRGDIVPLPQKSPTADAGLKGRADAVPLPNPNDSVPNPNRLVLHHAGRTSRSGQVIDASGDVSFSYRGYDVRSDVAHGNLETDVFVLTGNVIIKGEAQDVHGDRVVVDFREKSFAYENGGAVLGPSFVQGGLLKDLYVRGASGQGTRRQYFGQASELTTCDLKHPHYEFVVGSSDVKPGKRAVLRRVRLDILGHRILELPYVVIPLNDYGDRYMPEFGHSRDEGYYVKTKFSSPLRGDSWFDTKVDYFSKLGSGLGGDLHYFGGGGMRGTLRTYALTGGPQSVLYSIAHQQKLFGGALQIDGNAQRNNYLTAPGTRNYNGRLTYLINNRESNTRFAFSRVGSRSVSYGNVQQSFAVVDTRTWSKSFRTNLDLNLVSSDSDSRTGLTTQRKQMDLRLRGTEDLNRATAQFEYQRSIPIGKVQNFFGFADQTPLISLESDARRLFSPRLSEVFPFRASLSWGELSDSLKRNRITRTSFDFDVARSHYASNQTGSNLGVRFRQGLYSDGTAQYLLGTDLGYRYFMAKRSSLSLRYNYLRPYGYSPLSIDRSGDTNEVYANLDYELHRTLTFGAQSSYDILQLKRKQTPWQTVAMRSEWKPNAKVLVRTQANYDTFNRYWSNVRMDLGWRTSGGFVSAGTRFDGGRHTRGSMNLFAEGLKWGKLKTSVLLTYNGYSKQFEARHFSFTYDLHCAEAILQIIDNPVGFRSGREIAFFIRLKALPFDTPFGIGRRGQAIGTGTGFGF